MMRYKIWVLIWLLCPMLALADNTVEIAFKKGDILHQKKKHLRQDSGGVFTTTATIEAGNREKCLRVTVVEGEDKDADLNRVIGEIIVDGSMTPADLPAGTEVEIYLRMDEDRSLFLSVVIQDVDVRIMDKRLSLETVVNTPDDLSKKYREQLKSADEAVSALRGSGVDPGDDGRKHMDELADWKSSVGHRDIEEKLAAARGGGEGASVATSQAEQLIREFMKKVRKLKKIADAPILLREAKELLERLSGKLMERGRLFKMESREKFQNDLETAEKKLKDAENSIKKGENARFEDISEDINEAMTILRRAGFHLEAPEIFNYLCGEEPKVPQSSKPAYRKAMESGRAAMVNMDWDGIVRANMSMIEILRTIGIEIGGLQ